MLNIILRACTNHVQALNFCFIMCSLKSSNTLFKDLSLLLPHRGYTFDSAGLASATQPTLGNDVRDEATPLGVVLFLIAHHHHMRRMDYSRMISRMQIDFKKYNADGIGSPLRL